MGICLSEEGVAIAYRSGAAEPTLEYLAHLPAADDAARAKALAQLVKTHGLSGCGCVCVLPPDTYQLTQLEAPDVPAEELRAALRWRLKEFINYRVEDAVVDAFDAPALKARQGQRMAFAVSTPADTVAVVVEAVKAAGLRLNAIDIPELALRNLAAEVPDQAGGVALVALSDYTGRITISQGDVLYLARNLDYGARQLADNPRGLYDNLGLELQRSLDFYESQLAGRPASRVLVAPMRGDRDGLLEHLNGQLGTGAYALDLAQIVELKAQAELELQAECLLAVGGALREETAG